MKTIDFTQPGGFPLTQDQLGYLQDAFTEVLNGIIAVAGDGTIPFVISGAVITRTHAGGTLWDYAITDGWVYYQGNIIRVAAGGFAALDESVNAAYLVITPNDTPLTFNDGSTPNVILDSAISIGAFVIGTADDAGKFLYTHLQFALNGQPAFEKRVGTLDGDTVDMKAMNKTILYTIAAAANSFTIDMTAARPGAELLLMVPCNIGDTVTIAAYLPGGLGVHGYSVIDDAAAANAGFFYYKIKFVGVDAPYNVVTLEWYNPA